VNGLELAREQEFQLKPIERRIKTLDEYLRQSENFKANLCQAAKAANRPLLCGQW
jgi:hypothetical protein